MGSSALVSILVTAHIVIVMGSIMNFKFLFVFCFCLIGFSLAVPMPWVQTDFADIKTREVDIESPLSAHPSDSTVFQCLAENYASMEVDVEHVKKKEQNKSSNDCLYNLNIVNIVNNEIYYASNI